MIRIQRVVVLFAVFMLSVLPATAQSTIDIQDRGVTLEFPERLTFRARITGSAPIERVVLEYGVEKLTCGEVTAKAFPTFESGTSVDVAWTWEMLQSGSEPPGSTIWYRWRVTDTTGAERVSEEQRITWLDEQHAWRSVSHDKLTIHWYSGGQRFAQTLLDSAVESQKALAQTTGVTPQSPINLYIYSNTADMRDATLYEPGWTGGQAFPDSNIVIIGIAPDQMEWGKATVAHELTHVLVGHLTFSCLGSVPTWLNEGIAVYGEGGADQASGDRLAAAVRDNTLISVRALSGGFSEHPDKADLSYTQSYSLVNFLITEFGREKLLKLFDNLRRGTQTEAALIDAYGFGLDGLEDQWRASLGAKPRRADNVAPTATTLPTPVPTYQPMSGAVVESSAPPAQATTAVPTATTESAESTATPRESPTPQPAVVVPPLEPPRSRAPIVLSLLGASLVGVVVLVLGIRRKSQA